MQMNEQGRQAARRSARSSLRGLIVLNVALLIVLAAVTFGASVHGAQNRGRGEYTMVAGGGSGTDASIIWIVDVSNQEMIAMMYNPNTKVLDGVGYRSLSADAASVTHGRMKPNN